jgi:drug/metabolite transporter (DMT)-like permease
MNNQQPTRASIKVLFIAMLVGSVLIALIATFLPPYVDLDPETAMIMRIVLYAAAALSVGQAFWLKAKLTKQLPPEERKTGGGETVQRQ